MIAVEFTSIRVHMDGRRRDTAHHHRNVAEAIAACLAAGNAGQTFIITEEVARVAARDVAIDHDARLRMPDFYVGDISPREDGTNAGLAIAMLDGDPSAPDFRCQLSATLNAERRVAA